MNVTATKEHQWLQKLAGDWTFENECAMGPDQPPQKFSGKETVRMIGEIWAQCEGQGEMPSGGVGSMVMTLGFDPSKNRFVGSFLGSMMTNMWIYEGSLDPEGRVLTLDTVGPSFTDPGKMANYKDSIEFLSPDHSTLSSSFQMDDGSWNKFMTAHYYRGK